MRRGSLTLVALVALALTGCSDGERDVGDSGAPVGLPELAVARSWCPDLPKSFPAGLVASSQPIPGFSDKPLPPAVPQYEGDDQEYAVRLLCFFNQHSHGLSTATRSALPKLEPAADSAGCPKKLHGAVPFEYCLELDTFFYEARPGEMREAFDLIGQQGMYTAGSVSFSIYLSTKVGLPIRSGESVVCAMTLLQEGLAQDGVATSDFEPEKLRDVEFDKAMNGAVCPAG